MGVSPVPAGARRRVADGQQRTRPVLGPPEYDGHAHGHPVDAVSALRFTHAPEPVSLTSLSKDVSMLQSHVIDVDGAFVGAAVRLDKGYRFIATDIKLDDLDGSVWPTLADVQRLARRVYLDGRAISPARTS
jgi:hypothetical protein